MKDPSSGLNETSKCRKRIHVVLHYSQIFRLILLSHGSLTKAEEKVTVSIGDKKKREREKSEKLKRNRGQFLQGQKRKKEKPVAQRQEIVIGTFALV